MRLLVTRPERDTGDVTRILEARGHTVLLNPLLRIEPVADADVPDIRYQAVLVTSANGIRTLAGRPEFARLSKLPLLAVGQASSEAALAAGFSDVTSADGGLEDLVRLVATNCEPSGDPLLYLAGRTVSGDLKGMLEGEGYDVARVVLYDALETDALSPQTADALASRDLDGVLLYSPRTARIWARCTVAAGLESAALSLAHFCLSPAVARALNREFSRPPGDVRVAVKPDQENLLALLDA